MLQSATTILSGDKPLSADPHHEVIILMGTASAIEKCYSGMERILKILAENMDDYVPKGDTWHKSLINQMASDIESRPAVISSGTAQGLHVLRAFRHRERNSYSLDLDKGRVIELGEEVFSVMAALKSDLTSRLGMRLPESPEKNIVDSSLAIPFNQDGHFDAEELAHADTKKNRL
ncbi:MAG: ribonuclease toxin HepT-like protein [Acidithiobacillus sp.]